MNNIQTILLVVIISLTILLVVVGVQVMLIILDMRKALKRLNSILDDAILGGGLINPGKLTGIIEMIKRKKKMKAHGSEGEFNRL
jgi:hypothetical protein